ncbi:MAG: DNA topology modulation protein FlaR, partial [Oscillospiraceae bacterium]
PLLYLDTVQFEQNWKERERNQAVEIVSQFMKNSSWVIDGNYQNFLRDKRLEESDKIIFFDFPRRICFKQAFKRYKQNKGKTRESITIGCNEKFDFEFARWILFDGRTKKHRLDYKNILKKYPNKTIVLKNNNDTNLFLKNEINAK